MVSKIPDLEIAGPPGGRAADHQAYLVADHRHMGVTLSEDKAFKKSVNWQRNKL